MKPEQLDNIITERIAIAEVEKIWLKAFKWIPRDILQTDFGIDMTVEIIKDSIPSGGFFSVQIKGGESYFREINENYVIFRSDKRHFDYWLNYRDPVLIILHNDQTKTTLWQIVNESTVEYSSHQCKLKIPIDNELEFTDVKELLELYDLKFKSLIKKSTAQFITYLRPFASLNHEIDGFPCLDDFKNNQIFENPIANEICQQLTENKYLVIIGAEGRGKTCNVRTAAHKLRSKFGKDIYFIDALRLFERGQAREFLSQLFNYTYLTETLVIIDNIHILRREVINIKTIQEGLNMSPMLRLIITERGVIQESQFYSKGWKEKSVIKLAPSVGDASAMLSFRTGIDRERITKWIEKEILFFSTNKTIAERGIKLSNEHTILNLRTIAFALEVWQTGKFRDFFSISTKDIKLNIRNYYLNENLEAHGVNTESSSEAALELLYSIALVYQFDCDFFATTDEINKVKELLRNLGLLDKSVNCFYRLQHSTDGFHIYSIKEATPEILRNDIKLYCKKLSNFSFSRLEVFLAYLSTYEQDKSIFIDLIVDKDFVNYILDYLILHFQTNSSNHLSVFLEILSAVGSYRNEIYHTYKAKVGQEFIRNILLKSDDCDALTESIKAFPDFEDYCDWNLFQRLSFFKTQTSLARFYHALGKKKITLRLTAQEWQYVLLAYKNCSVLVLIRLHQLLKQAYNNLDLIGVKENELSKLIDFSLEGFIRYYSIEQFHISALRDYYLNIGQDLLGYIIDSINIPLISLAIQQQWIILSSNKRLKPLRYFGSLINSTNELVMFLGGTDIYQTNVNNLYARVLNEIPKCLDDGSSHIDELYYIVKGIEYWGNNELRYKINELINAYVIGFPLPNPYKTDFIYMVKLYSLLNSIKQDKQILDNINTISIEEVIENVPLREKTATETKSPLLDCLFSIAKIAPRSMESQLNKLPFSTLEKTFLSDTNSHTAHKKTSTLRIRSNLLIEFHIFQRIVMLYLMFLKGDNAAQLKVTLSIIHTALKLKIKQKGYDSDGLLIFILLSWILNKKIEDVVDTIIRSNEFKEIISIKQRNKMSAVFVVAMFWFLKNFNLNEFLDEFIGNVRVKKQLPTIDRIIVYFSANNFLSEFTIMYNQLSQFLSVSPVQDKSNSKI